MTPRFAEQKARTPHRRPPRSCDETGERASVRNCSVDRTLQIIADAWSFLTLREMYLGAKRFDEIQEVLGLPRSTLSSRLAQLVEGQVVARVQYCQAPPRFEYRLTEKGLDLYLVMLSMLRFGDDWLSGGGDPPMELVHATCGHQCRPITVCSACRAPVEAKRVAYRDGPGAGLSPAPDVPQRRRLSDDQYERGRPSSVSRTLAIIGDRWTFLVLRETFFGIKRFDAIQERLGIASNILTDRLNRLVAQNVLKRNRYQEQPDRFEYRLTAMGRALYLPMIEMLRWGDRWLGEPAPLILRHLDCGHDFLPLIVCDHCRQPVDVHEMRYRLRYPPLRRRGGPPAAMLVSEEWAEPTGLAPAADHAAEQAD